MDKHQVLLSITFGHRIAEEETDVLATYFVETDHWNRLLRGDIDVVYGPKGSGKSALYSLLLKKSGELFDRNILLIAGENPRGAPAFRDLATDPPTSEREFVGLWKLYIAALLHNPTARQSPSPIPKFSWRVIKRPSQAFRLKPRPPPLLPAPSNSPDNRKIKEPGL
jgi:hypothetical protein